MKCKHKWVLAEVSFRGEVILLFCEKCAIVIAVNMFDESGQYKRKLTKSKTNKSGVKGK